MTHRPIAPNAADVEVATATDPIETVTADSPDEIEALLHRLDRWHAI